MSAGPNMRTNMKPTVSIDRRGFLKTGAASAAGLVIGFYLPGRFEALAAAPTPAAATAALLRAVPTLPPSSNSLPAKSKTSSTTPNAPSSRTHAA